MPANSLTVYNGLGWFYDRYWRGLYPKAMPVLDRLVLTALPRGARILDVCCGTGHLAGALARRGLRTFGLDGSEEMLHFARQNASRAAFVVGDARRSHFRCCFDAVVSTFDSMNHLLTPEDLGAAFIAVREALVPGGVFVFDLNMAEAFQTEWHKSSTVAGLDHLCYVRGHYDRTAKLGITEVTTFRLNGYWIRQDLTILQRCYSCREVCGILCSAGFASVKAHPARTLGMRGRLAAGRTYFKAQKAR